MAFLVVASLVTAVCAKTFLHPEVGRKSIESALLSELSGMADAGQLQLIEAELGPMFGSLPKNQHGRLEPAAVRYALHRYFMQKHGWYINGLGPVNSTEDSSASATIMKDRAPGFIQNLFEERVHGQGLTHHDLAVFAATLTDLIHKEVLSDLVEVYNALELPTVGPVTEKEYEMATKVYLISYLSGGTEEVTRMEDVSAVESSFKGDYLAWDDSLLWADDLKSTSDFLQRGHLNPFWRQRRSFNRHVPFLQEFGHRLGTFQNLECHHLKNQLVELEDAGTGRVPLSRFYRLGLAGDWTFTEGVDYLRHIGALDETYPNRLSVVIPNWIQSQSNCFAGSSFYSVCCFDECGALLGHLEDEVKGPSASPSQVAAIVSTLHSETVQAPRNLSGILLDRLGQIAELHGGHVPLHGRLFAQWMHHAYPRECIFPHGVGASNRISLTTWADVMDSAPEASEEEMQQIVNVEDVDTVTLEVTASDLPWTMAEELVAGHATRAEAPSLSLSSKALRFVLALLILMSMAVPLARSSMLASPTDADKVSRYLV